VVQNSAQAKIGMPPDSFPREPTYRPCDGLRSFLDRLPTVQDHNGVKMFRVLNAAVFVCLTAAIGPAPLAAGSGPYANCTAAHNDGRWDIPKADPDYWDGGDRDHDGIACES
jgi:Excalibur calcium-binding domain